MPTALGAQIVELVVGNPAISTIGICRALRTRKQAILAELARLEREHLLTHQKGPRGAKAWLAVPEPSTCSCTCSRGTPGPTSDAELAESDQVA
jgi:hypothetical protein